MRGFRFSSLFVAAWILLLFGWPTPSDASDANCTTIVPSSGELSEPTRLNMSCIDTLYLYVVLKDVKFKTASGESAINMTSRVYCYSINEYTDVYDDSNCGIPGPTLIMNPGTTAKIRLYNALEGIGHLYPKLKTDRCNVLQNDTNWYYYNNPDVTNLHVHGLHVSPEVIIL